MKYSNIISIFCIISFLLMGATCFAQEDTTQAYNFVLDYQVPQSPAFTTLGANPTQVVRGSSAKPLVINLLTEFIQNKKFEPGIALDFTPYFIFGGQFKNINDYRNNQRNRLLANIQLSIAAIKNNEDTNATDIAGGIRITFWDDHDLLNNSDLSKSVGDVLSGKAHATPDIGDDDQVGEIVAVPELKKAYNEIYNKVRTQKGNALSGGYGVRSTARNSYFEQDSLVNIQHKMWMAFSIYSITKGLDLLINFQGTYADHANPLNKVGAALVSQSNKNNVGAEAVYDFTDKKLEGGFMSEFKLLSAISAIVGFSAVTDTSIPGNHLRFKLNTSLKWNLIGLSN